MSGLDNVGPRRVHPRRVLVVAITGMAAAGVYVGVAAWTWWRGGGTAVVLYDGMAPPARYKWLNPPRVLISGNQPPAAGTGTVRFGGGASHVTAVYTGDVQALVTFPPNAVVARSGETAVDVTIRPLDPGPLAEPPPGLRFDGNAYEIRALYSSSRAPAELRRPVSVILRYATGATHILRRADLGWTAVPSAEFPAALQRTADSGVFGVFVVAAPAELPYVPRISSWGPAVLSAAALGLGLLIGWIVWVSGSGWRRDSLATKRKKRRR